jgi:hypothetical protein
VAPPPAPPVRQPVPEPEPEIEPLLAEEDSTVIAPEPTPVPAVEPQLHSPAAPESQPSLPIEAEPEAEVLAEIQVETDAHAEAEPQPVGSGIKGDTGSGLAQHPSDAFHAADDEEVFVTASGKIIRVKKNRIVTAQTKRKVIRAGIIVAIAAVFVGILLIGGIAITVLGRSTGPTPEEMRRQSLEAAARAVGFSPKNNPYTLSYPNYVGIKLKPRFVIILDASSTGSSWFGDAADIVTPGLKAASGTVTGQVAVAADGGAKFYPAEPKPIDSATMEDIASNLLQTYPGGHGDILQAVDASLSGKPDQFVIVTSEAAMNADLVTKLRDLLANYPNISVDLVVMEGKERRPDMDTFIQARKGTYAMLPASAIREWKKDAP